MNRNKRLTTHMPVLLRAVQMTDGPVLELGAGWGSTPLLHWLCAENRRRLVTCEDDEHWAAFAFSFASPSHLIVKVIDWEELDIQGPWSVVLIDHRANRRAADALRVKDCAELVVIHDTEDTVHYGYEAIWPAYRYAFHWRICMPWTSVVSNRCPLEGFG